MKRETIWVYILVAGWFVWEIATHLPSNILSYDVYGAYLHLPARFIFNDPYLTDWSWIEAMNEKYNSTPSYYQFWGTETGRQVIKYPLGFAIIYAPFFFIGHVIAGVLGYEQDGFSAPYHWSIIIGHCFYVLLGLWVARKVLLQFFSEQISAILLFTLFAGTNFLFTTTASLAMPHGHLFLFFGLIIWFTIRWHENPSWKNSFLLSATLGIAALIRATEILACLIPLLWKVQNKETFLIQWKFLKAHKSKFLFMALVLVGLAFIQLTYYKLATGDFFVDAYNNAGEGFDFGSPYTFQYLFSARKGWLVYTPIFFLSFVGLWLMRKQKHPAFYALFVFAVVNIYVLSSWTCWWYAASFGQRSIVQSYLVFLIPLGFFLHYSLTNRIWLKFVSMGVFAFCIFLNQFQTWQIHQGLIHPSRMTSDAYWAHFLTTKRAENFDAMLLVDKGIPADEFLKTSSTLRLAKTLEFSFKGDKWVKSEQSSDTNFVGVMTSNEQIFTKDLVLAYPEITFKKDVVFRLKARVYCEGDPNEIQARVVFKMLHKGKPYYDQYIHVEKQTDLKAYTWSEVELVFYSADVRDMNNNEVQIFGWMAGKGSFKMDRIKIEVFEGLKA